MQNHSNMSVNSKKEVSDNQESTTQQPSTPTNQPIVQFTPQTPPRAPERVAVERVGAAERINNEHALPNPMLPNPIPRINLAAAVLPQYRRGQARRRLFFIQPQFGSCKGTEYIRDNDDDKDNFRNTFRNRAVPVC